jgi:hypothetical protein
MNVSDEQIHCVLLALQPVVAMASVKQLALQSVSNEVRPLSRKAVLTEHWGSRDA